MDDRWTRGWLEPPPDLAVGTLPPGGRARSAHEIGRHVTSELDRGRSLYNIVRDTYVLDRLGGFDGRALPPHCREEVAA